MEQVNKMIDEHVFCTIMKWFFEKFHFISVRQNTVIVPFLNRRNKWEIVAHKRIALYSNLFLRHTSIVKSIVPAFYAIY